MSKDGKNSGWVEVSGMSMERSDLGGRCDGLEYCCAPRVGVRLFLA